MSSRTPATLTNSERSTGHFETRSPDLVAVRNRLRGMVGLNFSLNLASARGSAAPDGSVSLFGLDTQIAPGVRFVSPPMSATLTPGVPFRVIDLGGLAGEFGDACASPLYAGTSVASDCSLSFDSSNRFVDAVSVSLTSAGIDLGWTAPSSRFNVSMAIARAPCEWCGTAPSGAPYCVDTCTPSWACHAGAPCPWGYACVGGTCEYQATSCTEDVHCVLEGDESGFGRCEAGTCTARSTIQYDSEDVERPVLLATLPWTVSTTTASDSWLTMEVNIVGYTSTFRVQPVPCASADCRESRRSYLGYRGASPSGDLVDAGSGLTYDVHGEVVSIDLETARGFAAGLACTFTPLDCEYMAFRTVHNELTSITQEQAALVETLINRAELLPRYMHCGETCNTLENFALSIWETDAIATLGGASVGGSWFSLAQHHTSIYTPETFLRFENDPMTTADDEYHRLFEDPDLSVTGALPEAIANGATIGGFGIDIQQIAAICGPNPGAAISGWCNTDGDGDGVVAWQDMTGMSPDPRAFDGEGRLWCNLCKDCLGSSSPLCNFGAINAGCLPSDPAPCVVGVGPTLPSGVTLHERVGSIIDPVVATYFPSMPEVARIVDASFGIAHEFDRVFAGPLGAFTTDTYYSDVRWCPGADPWSAECPTTASDDTVVFHFPLDSELDGIPDEVDLCPESSVVASGDDDGDGVGNECDTCLFHPGDNRDRDDDGAGDVCDCDLDGDACNNALLVDPVPPGTPTVCFLTGVVFDQDPFRSDGGANSDGDFATDHCDIDDDNDGRLDDGAGDGFGTYSPCNDGEVVGCDDNCRTVGNAGQADENHDGHGDACDPLCDGSAPTPPWCESSPEDTAGAARASGAGGLIERECLFDGPGCDFLGLECAAFRQFNSLPWPGIGGGCGTGASTLRVFDSFGAQRVAVSLGQLAPAGIAVARFGPDINADGLSDVFLGAPNPAGSGKILALSAANGALLWQKTGQATLGTSLVFLNGTLYSGAPSDANNRGRIYLVNVLNGATLSTILGPTTTMTGFGSSLAASNGKLLVGAPFAAQGRGQVLVLQGTQTVLTLQGPQVGDYLGAGPIVPFVYSYPYAGTTRDGIAIGAPHAQSGAGLVAVYQWNGAQQVVHRGSAGFNLGASLSAALDFNGDGLDEIFAGAPGQSTNRGGLFALGYDLSLSQALAPGTQAHRRGLSVSGGSRTGGGAVLVVGSGAFSHPNGSLFGAWARYEGTPGVP